MVDVEFSRVKPVFGVSLEDHLHDTDRQLSLVIEQSITALRSSEYDAVNEEVTSTCIVCLVECLKVKVTSTCILRTPVMLSDMDYPVLPQTTPYLSLPVSILRRCCHT